MSSGTGGTLSPRDQRGTAGLMGPPTLMKHQRCRQQLLPCPREDANSHGDQHFKIVRPSFPSLTGPLCYSLSSVARAQPSNPQIEGDGLRSTISQQSLCLGFFLFCLNSILFYFILFKV